MTSKHCQRARFDESCQGPTVRAAHARWEQSL
jgi:hypothetical protein